MRKRRKSRTLCRCIQKRISDDGCRLKHELKLKQQKWIQMPSSVDCLKKYLFSELQPQRAHSHVHTRTHTQRCCRRCKYQLASWQKHGWRQRSRFTVWAHSRLKQRRSRSSAGYSRAYFKAHGEWRNRPWRDLLKAASQWLHLCSLGDGELQRSHPFRMLPVTHVVVKKEPVTSSQRLGGL